MVRTRRATVATGTTIGGEQSGTSAAGASQSTGAGSVNTGQASGDVQVVPETPEVDMVHERMAQGQNPPSGDPSESDPSHHPSSAGGPPYVPPSVPPPDDNSDSSDEKELRKLLKDKRRAERKAKLLKLREAAKRGFQSLEEEPAAKRKRTDRKNQLAIELAKDITKPDFYSGESQQALDLFLQDNDTVFRTKPTIYASDEDKCLFAVPFLKETPRLDWKDEDAKIKADPARSYSWPAFVALLQKNIPKAQR